MTEAIKKPRGWNAGRCRFISETYLDWFLNYAAAEARKSDKEIDLSFIRDLIPHFSESESATQLLFQDSFFSCSQARLNKEWREDHHDHLIRLLIEEILPLFIEQGGPSLDQGGLSRTMLPGLFQAIHSAIGARVLLDSQSKCKVIVERLHAHAKDNFEWDDFFNDPEAQSIRIQTLAHMALGFDSFEQVREWFIETINKELSSAMAPPLQNGAGRRFDERQFAIFAGHFFLPLIETVFGNHKDSKPIQGVDPEERKKIETFLSHIAP